MKIEKLPNMMTVARMLMVPLIVAVYLIDFPAWYIAAGIIFILASITDLLDGIIARKKHCVTNIGKLMDPMADKLLVMAAMLILVDVGRLPMLIALIILAREFVISGVRLVAAEAGVVIAADRIGKLKTLFQMVGLALMLLGSPAMQLTGVDIEMILMVISVVLAVLSCIHYISSYISAHRVKAG